MKTAALRGLLTRATAFREKIQDVLAAREACPDAATVEDLVPWAARTPGESDGEFARRFARQSAARADYYDLYELRQLWKRLTAGFEAAERGYSGLTVSERVGLARRLQALAGERRGRPRKKGRKKGRKSHKKGANSGPVQEFRVPRGVETAAAAARAAGLGSVRTLRDAEAVLASGNGELIAAVDGGWVSVSAAARRVRGRAASSAGPGGL